MKKSLKNFCKGGVNYFGQGTVYISDAKDTERFDDANFDVVRLDRSNGHEGHVNMGAVVCLGDNDANRAINALQLVIDRIRREAVGDCIKPQSPRADAEQENVGYVKQTVNMRWALNEALRQTLEK